MSGLIKIEPNALQGLTQIQQEAVHAYLQPRIRHILEEDMVDPISVALALARLNKGQEGNEVDDEKNAEAIIITLKKSFTTYSLQDVIAAIDMGSKGLLNTPKTYKVSVENVFAWISAYNDIVRQEAYTFCQKYREAQEKKEAEEAAIANRIAFDKEIADLYRDFDFMEDLPAEKIIPYAIKYRRIINKMYPVKENQPLSVPKRIAIYRLARFVIKRLSLTEEEGIPEEISLASLKNVAEAIALKKLFELWRFNRKELTDTLELI